MKYESLNHLYYKNPNSYDSEYSSRISSPSARHIHIEIKQHNRKKAYPAFFCYTEKTNLLTEQIYVANQEFSLLLEKVPSVLLQQFYRLCIIDEVKASNDIEGVHSTRQELQEAMEIIGTGHRFVSTIKKYELLSQKQEIDFSCNEALRKFYDEFSYKEVLQETPSNALDGRLFRKEPVDIVSASGKVVHRGLYPEDKILNNMDAALCLLQDKNIPVLVRTAIFHYLFAYIHPFYDGNGRTSRFISSYTMAKTLHPAICLRLSVTIKKHKATYYSLFTEADSEINRGDLTPFLIGFLRLVLKTAEDSQRLLLRKLNQYERTIYLLSKITDDKVTLRIYELLFQAGLLYGRGLSVAELVKHVGKSKNTIINRLNAIPAEHLIISKTKKTNFYKLNMLMLRYLEDAK